jgi:hypothetical protein
VRCPDGLEDLLPLSAEVAGGTGRPQILRVLVTPVHHGHDVIHVLGGGAAQLAAVVVAGEDHGA